MRHFDNYDLGGLACICTEPKHYHRPIPQSKEDAIMFTTQHSNVIELPNINANVFGDIPTEVDFSVSFEPSLVPHKKYVIKEETGEALDVVGHKFQCASHPDYFRRVQDSIRDSLVMEDLQDAKVRWQTARNGCFALMDVTLPNVKYKVTTRKHQVDVSQRIVALHGIDGLCSNQVYFGAIDAFCTNGMISGDWEKIRRKNTVNFNLNTFIEELEKAKVEFHEHGRTLQTWASKDLDVTQVMEALPSIVGADRKAAKMLTLYNEEATIRGHNVYALYSAFTNYASYADERNGFELHTSNNDNAAVRMFKREQDVSMWVASPAFKALAA